MLLAILSKKHQNQKERCKRPNTKGERDGKRRGNMQNHGCSSSAASLGFFTTHFVCLLKDCGVGAGDGNTSAFGEKKDDKTLRRCWQQDKYLIWKFPIASFHAITGKIGKLQKKS